MSNLIADILVLKTVEEVRRWKSTLSDPESVGFVPTMGALHQGHLELVRHSLSTQKHTIVSIFVNPAQFGPTEDLSNYPSSINTDLDKLSSLQVLAGSYKIPHDGFDGRKLQLLSMDNDGGLKSKNDQELRRVTAVFLPEEKVLYPSGVVTDVDKQRGSFVTVHGLSEQLEGARRPGFFRGVATVVLKLFMIIEPTLGFFGQKDLQQCLLVRQLCLDLHLTRPKSIIIIPTVREALTGLALSSRNSYLSLEQKNHAKVLNSFLIKCSQEFFTTRVIEDLIKLFVPPIPTISLDFLSINDPITFDKLDNNHQKLSTLSPVVISGAILVKCYNGQVVRLIDNIVINHDLNHSL